VRTRKNRIGGHPKADARCTRSEVFPNATRNLTLLGRLPYHAEVRVIEGGSY